MKKPIIFCIDDDPQVLASVSRDVKQKYRDNYKVLSTTYAKEALEMLLPLKNKDEAIALFLVDQRMPEMEGVVFLNEAMKLFPDAKKVLLTAYSDTAAAIRAINEVRLDYYLTKPWNPPEEKLYPVLDELLEEWLVNSYPGTVGLRLIGYQFSPKSHKIKEFLAGNLIPYQWLDIEINNEAKELVDLNAVGLKDLPAIFFEDGTILLHPTIQEIASKIGLSPTAAQTVYDVVIIGAGPAGLAAAVYGASEGLKTLLIERNAPGGQAGTSSRIENYLGFPSGLSGAELTRRATAQAARLGAEFLSPREVKEIIQKDGYKIIMLEDNSQVLARAVIITTGVDYRKLEKKGIEDFTGAGIYYGAAMTEAAACKDKEVYLVGGGNSAGQAAVYLSKFAKNVYILIRRDSLSYTMSSYLVDQLKDLDNVQLIPNAEIEEAQGNGKLERLIIKKIDKPEDTVPADALFIFIGASPVTDWIGQDFLKDAKGFLETGRELKKYNTFRKIWKLERDPYLLETCTPGIFAAGDVRSGAMARVASAVGEGSMAISFVHRYLAEV
ncbi:FAD-dependent oxidoreductase [Flavobacterium sp.]|uniref:FAD-dependent oxidoreductase n=1 Tax=Flavobacterium sp. TaxID=239 RepID=UPI00263240AE|nr:FAD-dependent oxidoreductase [Flavobacterium sp.]